MIIRVEDLEPGGLHVETPLDLGPLRTDAGEAIRIEAAFLLGDVKKTIRGVELRGRLTCRAEVPCARCLTPFVIPVDRPFHLRYAFAAPRGRDIEIPDDDMDVDFLGPEGELELVNVATEQVYLELPMKPVCREDCRGLCSRCGVNLNHQTCLCVASLPPA